MKTTEVRYKTDVVRPATLVSSILSEGRYCTKYAYLARENNF
jgi:hypothetical protein